MAEELASDEIFRVRLCYTKHKRRRVAHEVIAGTGYRQMSIALWVKIKVRLRVRRGEVLLVRENKGELVPITDVAK